MENSQLRLNCGQLPFAPKLMDNLRLWHKFLELIKLQLSSANVKTFFSKTVLEKVEEDRVVLATSSAFIKETLNQRHLPLIETIFEDLLGKKVTVEITVKETSEVKQEETEEEIFRPQETKTSVINPKFTLENYVVGPTNNVAYAAAQAVAGDPGSAYNPLYIYGGTGVGKTHLMLAIGNAILKKFPHYKVIYCSSEKFMNDYVAAIQQHSMGQLRNKYRSVDVLLIDDIQFFSGREGTQEEFFHTFNELQGKNAQMVFTSDRSPHEIAKLEDRLKSRFVGGLMLDIQPPDYDTRVAILRAKCVERGEVVPEETIALLASTLDSNIRELEGKLIQILQVIKLKNLAPTVENIAPLINPNFKKPASLDSKQILNTVCTYFSLNQKDLMGPRRQKELVLPRHIAMYLLSEELSMTVEKIGDLMGGRDHTTVMHGRDRIKKLINQDSSIQRILLEIKQSFSTR